MKGVSLGAASNYTAATFLKLGSVFVLGTSVGLMSASYSPFVAVMGASVFALGALVIYATSARRVSPSVATAAASVSTPAKNGMLFYLFYLSLFLSLTIPKSGKTFGGVPITTANLVILFTLCCWLLTLVFSQRSIFDVPLAKTIAWFMLYGIGSAIIGVIRQNDYKAVILDFVAFIGFIVLYFLVVHVLRTEKQILWIVWLALGSIVLVCGYGLLQTRFGFARVAVPGLTEQYGKLMYQGVGRWNVIEGGGEKLYSTFQNGNIFGNHLATFIPFLGGILIGLPASKKKLVSIGVFLLACYVLILTYSRGALTGTVAGMVVLAVIAKKIRLRAVIAMLLIFSVLLIFLYKYADSPALTRYDVRRISSEPDRFTAGRLERAKQFLAGFARQPLMSQVFGMGFGAVIYSPLGWRFEYVDNLYLTLLFKMGVLGLSFLLIVLLQLFLTLFKLRARVPDLYFQGLINGGIAGLFASLVHNFADTLWFFPPLSANFWFLAGITIAIALIGSQKAIVTEPALVTQPARAQARTSARNVAPLRRYPSPT